MMRRRSSISAKRSKTSAGNVPIGHRLAYSVQILSYKSEIEHTAAENVIIVIH